MILRTACAAALLALPLSACAGEPAAPPVPVSDGYVKLGERVTVGPVDVRADKVTEDSRCPAKVQCVWAGQVTVAVTVWQGGKATAMNLSTGKPMPVAGGGLLLDAVKPGRETTGAIAPGDYRFKFAFR